MDVDSKRTKNNDIKIGHMEVPVKDDGKRLIVIDDQVVTSIEGVATANDQEASCSNCNDKYFFHSSVLPI